MRTIYAIGFLCWTGCGGMAAYVDEVRDPSIQIVTPPPGAWVDDHSVPVLVNTHRLEDVSINEVGVISYGGQVLANMPMAHGINVLEARGIDEQGKDHWVRQGLMVGPSADPMEEIRQALQVQIGRNGLNKLAGQGLKDFDSSGLEAIVKSLNPIFDDKIEGIKVRADIQHLEFDAPIISLDPEEGYLNFLIHIPNFWIYIDTDVHIIFEWDLDVEFGTDIFLSGRLAMEPTGTGLDIQLDRTDAWLEAFYTNIDFIPEGIEQRDIEPPLKQAIEDALRTVLADMAPGIVRDAVSEIDMGFYLPFGKKGLNIDMGIEAMDLHREGMNIGLSFDVDMPEYPTHVPGYLYAGDTSPSLDPYQEMSIAISDNMVNQLVFGLWASGAFNESISTLDETLTPAAVLIFKSDSVDVDIDLPLPPVVIEHNGGLQLQIGEVDITIHSPGGEFGEHLRMSASAMMDLDITLKDGALAMMPKVSETHIYVRETDWGSSREAVTEQVEEMLPIDLMLGMIGELSIPLDSLAAGSQDWTVSVDRNPSGIHTDISIRLP